MQKSVIKAVNKLIRKQPLWAVAALLFLLLWGPPWVSSEAREFEATVLRITDGDTLVVRTADFEELKVRLYGVDAPERKQPWGKEAAALLKPLQGQTVTVTEMDIDRYGRTVALVAAGGHSINLEMVAQGQAWHYAQYCQQKPICPQIATAERRARQDKKGLWAGHPVAPWEWRRRK